MWSVHMILSVEFHQLNCSSGESILNHMVAWGVHNSNTTYSAYSLNSPTLNLFHFDLHVVLRPERALLGLLALSSTILPFYPAAKAQAPLGFGICLKRSCSLFLPRACHRRELALGGVIWGNWMTSQPLMSQVFMASFFCSMWIPGT